MQGADEIREWWTRKILKQESSAHPIFGRSVRISIDGPVVTLSGQVEDIEESKQLEKEALGAPSVESVVNHLKLHGPGEPEHMQTLIAVFRDEASAQLASRMVVQACKRGGDPPDILSSSSGPKLTNSLRRAQVPEERMKRYTKALDSGKVLLLSRVPENDIFQVVSALEGTAAESVETLPPEPELFEEK
jgi:hypothetical protein